MTQRRSMSQGIFTIIVCIIMIVALTYQDNCNARDSGFRGIAFERRPDGSIGQKIAGVQITFVKENARSGKIVMTDVTGSYRISLSTGRYYVTATHRNYEDYSSIPGFFVVTGAGYQTSNIFLKEPRVTTVLLVRHAEKSATPPDDPPLTPEGEARAKKLAHVVLKVGVTAIYTTDTKRTKGTVQPLADFLKLENNIYNNESDLVNQVLSDHNGDVVLIAGHSPTVPQIARLLGAVFPQEDQYVPDFDNLFVVTRRSDEANVEANLLNLQYGESSYPEFWKGCNTSIKIRSGRPDGSVVATAMGYVPSPQMPCAQTMAKFKFTPSIEVNPGGAYVIEWIPSGDRILTWMVAEHDPYHGGNTFGCTGAAISDEDFIFKTYINFQPDQINDVTTGNSRGCGTPSKGNLFQSFTPSGSPLSAVDLRLRAGGAFPDGGCYPMTTFILVCHAESRTAGKKRSEKLAHVARKASVTTIYSSPTKETVQPLAISRGLKVKSYNPNDLKGFVNQLLTNHAGEAVVIAGQRETLSEIIKKLGGSPMPTMMKNEYDNLVVITVCGTGDAKVVNLQYGESSP